jgi:hypothetical protein
MPQLLPTLPEARTSSFCNDVSKLLIHLVGGGGDAAARVSKNIERTSIFQRNISTACITLEHISCLLHACYYFPSERIIMDTSACSRTSDLQRYPKPPEANSHSEHSLVISFALSCGYRSKFCMHFTCALVS